MDKSVFFYFPRVCTLSNATSIADFTLLVAVPPGTSLVSTERGTVISYTSTSNLSENFLYSANDNSGNVLFAVAFELSLSSLL